MTTTKELIKYAQNALEKAYAPYSKFQVGASILDENNQTHAGCNVENSAYPEGVCAEASAISQMVVNGGQKIKKIMLVSSGQSMVTPCGGCRQKIREFSDGETEILIHHNGETTIFSINDLLPQSFSKEHL